ncbi:MAG: hypothetical protein KC729_01890 [Candidatus Eisenbacteria bacterium]|uniref:Uncharacterized protein n=1 Tax=Eiseniibacteriota bacterium TaxID=2212470 RepID=A0A956RMU2_UNCEI|nr:hypothetical protein [Candidatus Eisenbacteria bacterium]
MSRFRQAAARFLPGCRPMLLLGIAVVPGLLACSQPMRDGPRIRQVPEGFIYDANASQARSVLLDVEKADEGAWIQMTLDDEHSSIFITRYAVGLDPRDVEAAYEAYVERYPAPGYTRLEEIEIDGRPAWGFAQTQWTGDALCAVSYCAIIPYESQTFAVEFFSDMERWLDPVSQREVVSRFEVPHSS